MAILIQNFRDEVPSYKMAGCLLEGPQNIRVCERCWDDH